MLCRLLSERLKTLKTRQVLDRQDRKRQEIRAPEPTDSALAHGAIETYWVSRSKRPLMSQMII